MPRFFVQAHAVNRTDNIIIIEGNDAFHIARSLRMAQGEHITVSDMQRNVYTCSLKSISDRLVEAEILSIQKTQNEPPFCAFLFQALPKGDKLESVIQKSVECGVSVIIPFESERCVVKMKKENEDRKTERRRKIAEEAAKQSGRDVIPDVMSTVSFAEMLEKASKCDIKLFCYEGEDALTLRKAICESLAATGFNRTDHIPTVAIVIGSEGGFSQKECDLAREYGLTSVGLGKRILRTETASTFVLSALVYQMEL
ncbi:MAG: 16S rRNA (uracil(1498)-N(3))-methyltransferase [Clostridia bacterium]|nr:16S rRNA (uracil(1498)-N(3))-methyltransferase [Clostridia bacterium]